MSKFMIHESNIERLTKKLNRIEKKCHAYGIPFTYAETGNEFRECDTGLYDSNGKSIKEVRRFVEIEVEGTAIVNDWEYMAKLEPTSNGNLIEMSFRHDSVDIPSEYWKVTCSCDHCKTNRGRKFTYLVRNVNTFEWKQLGKSCLQEYTLGMSAEWIAQYVSAYEELIKGEAPISTDPTGYGRYMPIDEILLSAIECVNHFGYVKAGFDDSTSRRAEDFWRATTGRYNSTFKEYYEDLKFKAKEIGFEWDTEANRAVLTEYMNWIDNLPEEDNYTHNLKTMAKMPYISATGIIVSGLVLFNRFCERKSAEEKRKEAWKLAQKKAEHVGAVGDRLKDIRISSENVKILAKWENTFSYYGEIVYMIQFVDDNGNVYIWKTQKSVPDGDILLSGTVKEHGEYKGLKQNIMTRCKVTVA